MTGARDLLVDEALAEGNARVSEAAPESRDKPAA